MPSAPRQKGNKDSRRLAAVDQLLTAAIEQGPAKKRDAINRILELVPDWNRGDCWQRIRHLRKTAELAAINEHHPEKPETLRETAVVRRSASRPWTTADDDRLLDLAGYERADKIAQRLSRSVPAVRFRLGALGMSARVTDGWSLRELRKLLHIRTSRLRHFIGNGILRVRDARISASSLAIYCEKNRQSLAASTLEKVGAALSKKNAALAPERVADLLGVELANVRSLTSIGRLRLVDTFVTDRAFEEFCKKHSDKINTALIDPATVKWLVSDYGVSQPGASGKPLSRAQKHVLAIRECKCGRRIAGNAYFIHIKRCILVASEARQKAV
jgi:hypothetical protein